MNATTERVRAELEAETGIDFARYRDDAFVDTVTGWTGLMGVAVDGMIALGVGAVIMIAHVVAAAVAELGAGAAIGLTTAGFVSGVGVTVVAFAHRLRRRIPAEADKVFVVTGAMTDRVVADIGPGGAVVTPAQAARGMALVAAIPVMTRMARRRFPVMGTIVAPVAGAVLARTLARVWPEARGGETGIGLEATAHRVERAVGTARAAVVPRLAGVVRWATLPLVVAGSALVVLGGLVAAVVVMTV